MYLFVKTLRKNNEMVGSKWNYEGWVNHYLGLKNKKYAETDILLKKSKFCEQKHLLIFEHLRDKKK